MLQNWARIITQFFYSEEAKYMNEQEKKDRLQEILKDFYKEAKEYGEKSKVNEISKLLTQDLEKLKEHGNKAEKRGL